MTNSPGSSPRGWRHNVPASATRPAGPERGWTNQGRTIAVAKPWSRMAKLRLALACLALCAGLIALLIWYIWPPKPAALVLVGADYEQNLLIDHNLPGSNALDDLQNWTDQERFLDVWRGRGMPRLHLGQVTKLGPGQKQWDRGLDDIQEQHIIVFLNFHGAADNDSDGPYLLLDGDPTAADNRLPIRTVLRRLMEVAARKEGRKVLLILDPTQVTANWSIGMFHNDFARRLKELDGEIKESGNLLVLCSTDTGQKSWVFPQARKTIFGYEVIEGLKGAAADDGGQVTALALFNHVHERVKKWVAGNRDMRQTPILLPAGDDGRRLAENMVLVTVDKSAYREPELSPLIEEPREVLEQWDAWHRLRHQPVPPWTHSPHLWREYQDVLLRYEQVVRSGGNGDRWKVRLGELRDRVSKAAELALQSAVNAFPASSALGLDALDGPGVEAALLNLLQDAHRKEDRDRRWRELADAAGKVLRERGIALDDRRLQELLELKAAERVARRLVHGGTTASDACRLLGLLWTSPLEPPVEAHLLLMVHAAYRGKSADNKEAGLFAGKDSWPAEIEPLVRKMLEVRLLAERVAWGAETAPTEPASRNVLATYPYAERVAAWINLDEADQLRRIAEDLLFSALEKDWKHSAALFDEAMTKYLAAAERGRVVREAYRLRDQALADLPYYSRWLARRRAAVNPKLGAKLTEEVVNQWLDKELPALWADLHELSALLNSPSPAATLEPIKLLKDRLNDRFNLGLAEQFRNVWSPDIAEKAAHQHGWHEVEDLLLVPLIEREGRLKLWQRSRMISSELLRGGQAQDGPSEADDKARALKTAGHEARMALECLGPRWIETRPTKPLDRPAPAIDKSHKELVETLRLTLRAADWQGRLNEVGEYVAYHYVKSAALINERTAEGARRPLTQAAAALADADYWTRLCDSRAAQAIQPAPALLARKLAWHFLLVRQAQRVYRDHWYAANGSRYYLELSRRYLADAEVLISRDDFKDRDWSRELEPWRTEAPPFLLAVQPESGKELIWTTEPHKQVAWKWETPAAAGPGRVVTWQEYNPAFRTRYGPDGRRCVEIPEPQGLTAMHKEVIDLDPPMAPRRPPPLVFRGYFRGQVARVELAINYQPEPDVVVRQHEFKNHAGIAAVADQGGQAAIAFVFDCSNSMNKGKPKKYDEAVSALEQLFKQIPPGTYVSFRVFGHEAPDKAKNEGNDKYFTTARIHPPSAWKENDGPEIIKKLKALGPKGGTPAVKAIVEAFKNDFPANFRGFRTIVVLTDGMDTEKDTDPWTKGSDPAWVKKTLRDGLEVNANQEIKNGVFLSMLLFKVHPDADATDEEKRATENERRVALEQFRFIQDLVPPGQLHDIKETADLFKPLQDALRPKLRLLEPNTRKAFMEVNMGFKSDLLHWSPKLAMGPDGKRFHVQVHSNESEQDVYLKPEDRLVLLTKTENDQIVFKRGLYARLPASSPLVVREAKEWTVAAWQNAWLRNSIDRRLQMMFTLEDHVNVDPKREPGSPAIQLGQPQPGFTWFEIRRPGADEPAPARFGNLVGYPGPARYLESPEWHEQLGEPPAMPTVEVWWGGVNSNLWTNTTEIVGGFAMDGVFRRQQLGDSATWVNLAVSIEKDVLVEISPGVAEPRTCLVVRLEPVDRRTGAEYLVHLPTESGAGVIHEHRFFSRVGCYTGVFVLDNPERYQAGDGCPRLQIRRLSDFKNNARAAGQYLELKFEQPPRVDGSRPLPVFLADPK